VRKLMVIVLIVAAAGGFFLYSSTRDNTTDGNSDLETLAKERDALVSVLQERLDDIRSGIEDLKKQSELKTGESRNALEEKIKDLQSEWDDARSQMERVASAGADQWQSIVGATLSAFDRMKNTYEAAKSELTK
jgi:peptidoglycan hydrolase CwlO-like protein